MPGWLASLLANPTLQIAITRGVMFVLAYLFHSGSLPTGHDGLGDPVAALLSAVAVAIPAGERNQAHATPPKGIMVSDLPPPPVPPPPEVVK